MTPLTLLLAATLQADCPAQLDWAATYAARNYAGFDDKAAAAHKPAYDSLLTALRTDAASAGTDAACDAVLRRWTAFFHDGHLSLTRRSRAPAAPATPPSDAEVRARFASWDRVMVDEATVRARLATSHEPVEGIWESLDGRYRAAVLRDAPNGNAFTMSILGADSVWWTPGQVKARLTVDTGGVYRARFFMRDHSEQAWTARVNRNLLVMSTGTPWIRRWPTNDGDVAPDALRASMNVRFAAREVAPGTVLVQIPTFNDPKSVDSLFAKEGDRIRAAETLIVDVRGNGGGSDYNFRHFIPLLYTGPIRSVGMSVLATDDNIRANELMAADTTYPEGQRAGMRRTNEEMRKHRGGWWVGDDGTTRLPTVLEKPARIAILVDRGCASSCEQFLLAARQSTKVTLYGDRSAGILDYGNVRTGDMPNANLTLHYPTTRTKRLPAEPIDNIGIAPHVRIPIDEPLPIDWVLRRLAERP